MKEKISVFINIFVISFVLNLIWENIQAPLYEGYYSFTQHFWICFKASLGDAVIITFIFFMLALFFKNILWFQNLNWKPILFLVVIGMLISIGIEKWALATLRWHYAYNLPIIPIIKVGLTPVLQMMILPVTTFYILLKIRK